MTGTLKSSFVSVTSTLKPKRKHLRKYSWLPDVLRIKGSIIPRIAWPVLTNTIFSTAVAYAWSQGYRVVLTNSVVPLLSVVVGLILVFRNGTSYDRFWDGRKSFSTMTSNVRNLSRLIWVNVAPPPTDQPPAFAKGKTPTGSHTAAQIRRRKVDALHLCLAFAFAVKHYLRGEDGLNWGDYRDVLPAGFARFDETGNNSTTLQSSANYSATANSNAAGGAAPSDLTIRPDATKRVRPKRSKNKISGVTTPLLSDTHRTVEFHPFADHASIPLPLLISHELTRALFWFRREGYLETVGPAGVNAMNQLIQSMVDQMTSMERVANTPIPISYGIHLKQCVSMYLFALPLTLVSTLGWMTIPIVTVVAFTFMGIEGIADEIEMPFGNDQADLPLDRYCEDLKEEIFYIIERFPEGGEGMYGYDDGEGDD
ncbi:hypothetical protein VNI00_008287 [Paramarasmius palmivorus]|uniref:Uncharacterized protein n=1 Tax=Paramarasmius palmivorus TaxID=297713 RepID=A0AAW0CUW4_9AGAR